MASRKTLSVMVIPWLLASACTVAPPQEDPVMVKLDDIDGRLAALERIIANGSLVDMTVQIDELNRQVAELRGRAEYLEYEAQGATSRQRELYVDLDDRIQELESARGVAFAAVAGVEALAPGQLPVPGGTDRDNYQAAFEMLKEQRYEPAGQAFQQFLISFPQSQLVDNAQYWLAESYYVTDRFEEALQQFQVVITKYPRSRKIPDALLKVGYSNYELQRFDAARTALDQVQADYADSTAARLAEQRLNRMNDEGN